MNRAKAIKKLENFRKMIRSDSDYPSWSELFELQNDLGYFIEPGDVELLEWAAVPERHAYSREKIKRYFDLMKKINEKRNTNRIFRMPTKKYKEVGL